MHFLHFQPFFRNYYLIIHDYWSDFTTTTTTTTTTKSTTTTTTIVNNVTTNENDMNGTTVKYPPDIMDETNSTSSGKTIFKQKYYYNMLYIS